MDTMLHPVIASREVTRYILETFGLRAKKKFGQNFLINEKWYGALLNMPRWVLVTWCWKSGRALVR